MDNPKLGDICINDKDQIGVITYIMRWKANGKEQVLYTGIGFNEKHGNDFKWDAIHPIVIDNIFAMKRVHEVKHTKR